MISKYPDKFYYPADYLIVEQYSAGYRVLKTKKNSQ